VPKINVFRLRLCTTLKKHSIYRWLSAFQLTFVER